MKETICLPVSILSSHSDTDPHFAGKRFLQDSMQLVTSNEYVGKGRWTVLFSILLLRIDGNFGAKGNQTEEISEWAAGRNIGPQSSHSYTELPTSSC